MKRGEMLRLASASTGLVLAGPPAARAADGPAGALHALTARSGGRLGVFALDSRSERAGDTGRARYGALSDVQHLQGTCRCRCVGSG